ncbi:MAG: dihydropteroate synthase, partial [Candidatus Geothermarchaeales archaeon]
MTHKQGRARLGGIAVGRGQPVRISAAINVSPESFYKKSVATTAREMKAMVVAATEEGADLLDVGGMSSAPYLDTYVSAGEETERVVSAIRVIRDLTDLPISIDTQRAAVAEAAVKVGATI